MEGKKRKATGGKKKKADNKKRKAEDSTDSPSETELTEDVITALVDNLSKEQLARIAKQASLSHADVLSKVRKLADEDPATRKLFIRGLSYTTETDILKKAFEEYGPIEDAIVIMDKSTGKSKGFGFITFKHRDAAVRALKEPNKKIDGRNAICYLSGARDTETTFNTAVNKVSSEPLSSRKIYVGNLRKSTQKGTLMGFFSQYGEIEDGPLGFDKKTGKCKGYALLVYKTQDAARKCLEEPTKEIDGQKVQCKFAETLKSKEEGGTVGPSMPGYDVTNPALIASHNPLFLQGGTSSLGQSLVPPVGLSSLRGVDPLLSRSAALLAPESAFASSSLASLYGLPASNPSSLLQGSIVHPSLTSMHSAQALGYSSLPRSAYY